MSVSNKGCWMKRLGIVTLALLGIGAVTLQSTPADARVFFDVGFPATKITEVRKMIDPTTEHSP